DLQEVEYEDDFEEYEDDFEEFEDLYWIGELGQSFNTRPRRLSPIPEEDLLSQPSSLLPDEPEPVPPCPATPEENASPSIQEKPTDLVNGEQGQLEDEFLPPILVEVRGCHEDSSYDTYKIYCLPSIFGCTKKNERVVNIKKEPSRRKRPLPRFFSWVLKMQQR
ncbi:hypothetical protein DNTS_028960, partial [Danionella cerebrum]